MKCPNDNSELVKEKYEGEIEIDKCETCGGVWLDKGELEAIQELKVNDYSEELKETTDHIDEAYALAKAKKQAAINCPKCGEEMERREYGYTSQVLIDSCVKGHGMWLDRHELSALEVFYEKSRQDAGNDRIGLLGTFLDFLRK